MFSEKMGTWYVESKSDPRWNQHGRGEGLVCCGGPQAIDDWLESCKARYGEVPKDATRSFFKD